MLRCIAGALLIVGTAAAQTSDTTCQQYGVQVRCSTTHYQQPAQRDFHFNVPDIAGAFERGRQSVREQRLQEEQLKAVESAQHATYASELSYWSQQYEACSRIALREQPENPVDALEACIDRLLVTDTRFAAAHELTKDRRGAVADAFIQGLEDLAKREETEHK